MPKPTFLQRVRGKPSRSYADPSAPSPYSVFSDDQYYAASRYASRVDYDYDDDNDEGDYYESDVEPEPEPEQEYEESEHELEPEEEPEPEPEPALPPLPPVASSPGHRARKAKSVVSIAPPPPPPPLVEPTSFMTSRFPQPARKPSSAPINLADFGLDRRQGSRPASVAGMVKRKKKKNVGDGESTTNSRAASIKREYMAETSRPSLAARSRIPSANSTSTSSSAASSSSLPRPRSPVKAASPLSSGARRNSNAVMHKVVAGGDAPPTPPSSEPSSSRSSRERMNGEAMAAKEAYIREGLSERVPEQERAVRHSPIVPAVEERQIPPVSISLPPPAPAPVVVEPLPEAAGPALLGLPTLSIQPPTPAPFADPEESPFHKESPSPATYHLGAACESPSRYSAESQQVEGEGEEEGDVNSDHGEPGTEDEEDDSAVGALTNGRSSAPPSRPPSVAYTAPLLGDPSGARRLSRQSSRNSNDMLGHTRRPSIPASEASYGGRSAYASSIRSSGSGFGKGGWAAAAAASQSGRSSTPQMFMPTGSNSGWAEFQVPIAAPPPRKSKFTPMPQSYQPPSFDRLVNGDRSPGASVASASVRSAARSAMDRERTLGAPVPATARTFARTASQPSTYSQGSEGESEDSEEEEDRGPKPSRSYAQQVQEAYDQGLADGRERRYSNGPLVPARDPRRGPPSPRSDYSHSGEHSPNGLQRGSLSAPQSEVNSIEEEEEEEEQTAYTYASQAYSRPASRAASTIGRAMSPTPSMYDRSSAFPRPAFLDPDVITILPEMTPEDSERMYRPPSPGESEGVSRRKSWLAPGGAISALGQRKAQSVVGAGAGGTGEPRRSASVLGFNKSRSEIDVGENRGVRRAKSVMGFRGGDRGEGSKWEGSSYGDGLVLQSDGTEDLGRGYNTMILPTGAFTPVDPSKKRQSMIDPRILGLPHTTMATLCLSSSAHRLPMTPLHLRANMPPPVDFTSHVKPPAKIGNKEVLVQVYAVAVDTIDIRSVEDKGKGDVGKWVPGRSFVGRCLGVGTEEKEIVRGEIVVGLLDIRKSGALAEYILCDRRRVSRAPHPTTLTLEQLALLPLYGIPATRAVRGHLTRGSRALITDAHEGTAALICQEMSRAGVNITALIGGGEMHHEDQTRCLQHGARGVLTGAPAAVMLGLDEDGWDMIVDTRGTQRVYEAAKRMLKDGGKIISLAAPDPSATAPPLKAASKPSGFRTLRQAFASRRKNTKHIGFTYVPPAGSGEAEVDTGGMDVRDVLEEPCMAGFRPVLDQDGVWPFEQGMEAFRERGEGAVGVVRIIN